MLIETKNKGGGDGGGEDFSLGAWSAAECPKAMPCGDCGEKCNQNAYNFKICQYDDKQVNCIGGGVWYYVKEDQERSSIQGDGCGEEQEQEEIRSDKKKDFDASIKIKEVQRIIQC